MSYFDAARLNLDKSNCLRRHYACVIVMGGQIISWGHNTSLTGCNVCAREGAEHNVGNYSECSSVHAEMVALIKARENSLEGAELYLVCDKDQDPEPCPICQRMMDFAGVKQVKEDKHV